MAIPDPIVYPINGLCWGPKLVIVATINVAPAIPPEILLVDADNALGSIYAFRAVRCQCV